MRNPSKRQSADSPVSSPPKRQRKNEDGLICCISLALPLDPVTAEDGQIYDRNAIEDYFKSKDDGQPITSPITRQVIGTKLLPSPRIKSTIETLIENGAITGPPADDWKNRMMEKNHMEELLKDAEEGHVKSMHMVAIHSANGSKGFKRDLKEAYKWYEKARLSGSVFGLAKVGEFLVGGFGVAQNMAKGLTYLGMATGLGSDIAAFILGLYMAEGRHGVPVDKVEAQKFLEKCLSGNCLHKNMNDAAKRQAKELMDQLVEEYA